MSSHSAAPTPTPPPTPVSSEVEGADTDIQDVHCLLDDLNLDALFAGFEPETQPADAKRTAENTGGPVVAQELARHKDLRTTQGYLHARLARVLARNLSVAAPSRRRAAGQSEADDGSRTIHPA